MGSFGERLRREREKRNIRLEQIAEATKIGTRSLKALEDENFKQLPGGIFNKGFIRAYARYLGIDEEEAIAEYVAAAGGEQSPSPDLIAQQRVMAKASRLAAEQASQSRGDFPATKLLVSLLVIAALVYGGIRLYRGGVLNALRRPSLHSQMNQPAATPTATPVPQPTATPAVADASPTPEASPSPTQPSAAVAAIPGTFVLSIKSSEECWVSIQTDGVPELTGTLAPNEQKTFRANSKIDLVIGHPSSTELSLNGKPLLIPGDLSHSRRIVVGAGGIQTP